MYILKISRVSIQSKQVKNRVAEIFPFLCLIEFWYCILLKNILVLKIIRKLIWFKRIKRWFFTVADWIYESIPFMAVSKSGNRWIWTNWNCWNSSRFLWLLSSRTTTKMLLNRRYPLIFWGTERSFSIPRRLASLLCSNLRFKSLSR